MKRNQFLLYVLAFVLGYLVSRMMGGQLVEGVTSNKKSIKDMNFGEYMEYMGERVVLGPLVN